MNLLAAILLVVFVGMTGAALSFGLICFVVGVHRGDRADLDSAPGGLCSRFARRAAGLHVIPPNDGH